LKHLRESLGYSVATFVRSVPELVRIAEYEPFQATEFEAGAGLYIAFLQHDPTDEAHQKLMSFRNATDDFHVHQRQVYWLCRTRFSDSTFSGPKLEKTLGLQATVRNSSTVKKIAAKYALLE
jgi:uncharacterized protein (DUF1697 family)